MSDPMDSYLQSIYIDSNQAHIHKLLEDSNRSLANVFKTSFENHYDRATIVYEDANGNPLVTGQTQLEAWIAGRTQLSAGAPKPHRGPIYARPAIYVDGAFEGGGAKGLAYLGALHAAAHCGIWFKRVAGTSAGSITAALIAAGYRVDLNYELNVLTPPLDLVPSATNSINQIMFEDNFGRLADFKPEDDPRLEGSWAARAIDELLDYIPFIDQFRDLETVIMKTRLEMSDPVRDYLQSQLETVPDFGGLGTLAKEAIVENVVGLLENGDDAGNQLIQTIRKQFLSQFLIIQPSKWGSEMLRHLVTQPDKLTRRKTFPPAQVRNATRGLVRLLEHGGFFTGDDLRDWVNAHLRAKIGHSSGPNGMVLFRDLPNDVSLAIVAVDVGKAGTPADISADQTVIFSSKTTPNYPVAEAVRRSVSLPFAFQPKTISQDAGNNPPNITRQFSSLNSPSILTDFVTRFSLRGKPVTPISAVTAVDYQQHHDHVLLDGGFRVNLPVGVFRDKYDLYMDNNFNSSGEPNSFLFAFNLNDLKEAPPRPRTLPPLRMPEPVRSLLGIARNAVDAAFSRETDEPWELEPSEGIKRLLLAAGQTVDFGYGARAEQEITTLLSLIPKTVTINIPVVDPDAAKDGSRIGGHDFGVPKVTKKWWSHGSWLATTKALNGLADQTGVIIGIADQIKPYDQVLNIELRSPASYQVVGYEGLNYPSPFVDVQDCKFELTRVTAEFGLILYGDTIIRTAHSDRANAAQGAIEFSVDRPVRVTVFTDSAYTSLPGFLNQWTRPGWTAKVTSPEFRRVPGLTSSVDLLARYRDFQAGRIRLDGPRADNAAGNRVNYVLFVTAR